MVVKNILSKISESDSNARAFLDGAPDGMIIVNEEGQILFVNTQAEKLFGYTRNELVGHLIEKLVPASYRDKHILQRNHYFENPKLRPMGIGMNLFGERKNSEIFPVEISLSPIKTKQGLVVLAAVRDITERKQLEEQMQNEKHKLTEKEQLNWRTQETNRVKNELLANLSHELLTPLNAIIGYSEIIQEEMTDSATSDQKKNLDTIISSANHLTRLISDLLHISEMGSEKIEFRCEQVDLVTLVNDVVVHLSKPAEKKQINVTVNVSPDMATAYIDPYHFKQVIYNYLANAIKFTPQHGSVEIRIKLETEETFRLEVEDSGIGIQPNDLEKLFVEFQQIDSGPMKKYSGIGLGLALIKRIIEAQNGRVGVTSEPNKGSTFYAIIPRDQRIAL